MSYSLGELQLKKPFGSQGGFIICKPGFVIVGLAQFQKYKPVLKKEHALCLPIFCLEHFLFQVKDELVTKFEDSEDFDIPVNASVSEDAIHCCGYTKNKKYQVVLKKKGNDKTNNEVDEITFIDVGHFIEFLSCLKICILMTTHWSGQLQEVCCELLEEINSYEEKSALELLSYWKSGKEVVKLEEMICTILQKKQINLIEKEHYVRQMQVSLEVLTCLYLISLIINKE